MKLVNKLLIAALMGMFFSAPSLVPSEKMSGVITDIQVDNQAQVEIHNATVALESGQVTAQIYETQVGFGVGDRVLLYQDPTTNQYTVADYARTKNLVQLFVLFLLAVVIVSGVGGLRSILGLACSFAIIFSFVLPQIAVGNNPLVVTLIGASVIMLFSYYLTHGISVKTTIAIIGTIGSLVITAILAFLYTKAAHLSGFGSEEVSFLLTHMPSANMQNLLLAGMIIATLGVLDDITISQASVVTELREANPKMGVGELFNRAMKVGRDHIASVVNTLVLVYAGTALPLLLLFTGSQASTTELLNYEVVAEEIVRTLVGSIGLVTAVPITTFIASVWKHEKR